MIFGLSQELIIGVMLNAVCLMFALTLGSANALLARLTAVSTLAVGQIRTPRWVDRAFQAILMGITVFFATAWVTADGWTSLAVLVLALWLAAMMLRLAGQWLVGVLTEEQRVRAAIAAIDKPGPDTPRFAFYFSAPDLNRPTHVLMWYKYLLALGIPFVIILREQKHLKAFPDVSDVPVVFVRKAAELNNVLPSGVRTVFYANNGQKNRFMVENYPDAMHIQLLHGDSDKPPSYSPMSKIYSKLFVAGQMAVDRYAQNGVHIPTERFRVVGRPQVSKIRQTRAKTQVGRRKVAYMPTWRGFFADTQFSSLERALDVVACVQGLKHPAGMLFKPHPMSYKDPLWPSLARQIRQELAKGRPFGSTYFGDETDPFDVYNNADVLITDISSVMIDFLYSGKPYLVIKPAGFGEDDLARFPSMKGGYLVNADLSNLSDQLALALGDDPMHEQRLITRNYAFGDISQPPGAAFRSACLEVLDIAEPCTAAELECA